MEKKDLRNYGKSLLQMMEDVPQAIMRGISETSFKLIEKHLNPDDLERFISSLPEAKGKMLRTDLSHIRAKGLNSSKFIYQQVEWTASFSVLSNLTGRENTLDIFRKISETTYPQLFFAVFPDPEDFKNYADPLYAFKEWFLAMMAANKKAGLFEYKIAQNAQDVFQIDCVWCAWYATYKQLGVEEACIPVCHADDAFYPEYFQQTDIRYKRTKTIGWGNDCCDFCFGRSHPTDC